VAAIMLGDGVGIYSLPSLRLIKEITLPSVIVACAFQPGGNLLALLTERNGLAILQAMQSTD